MYSKTKTGKATRGTVGVEPTKEGRLRLTIPAVISPDGKQKRPSLGLADTPSNRAKAESIAMQANLDLANGEFDITLEKYLGKTKPKLAVIANPNNLINLEPTIREVWDLYISHIKIKGSRPRTIQVHEREYFRLLIPYLDQQLSKTLAIQIRDKLVAQNTHNAKRTLAALENAVEIAVQRGKSHIVKNPFFEMSKDIKVKKQVNRITGVKNEYKSFTREERDLIIQECYKHSEWFGNFIYAKFHTGARPGELQALTWNDISSDFSKIYITKIWDNCTKQIVEVPKNGENRTFHCPKYLTEWFNKLKNQGNKTDNDLVFINGENQRINSNNISNIWAGYQIVKQDKKYYYPGIVETLTREGLIAEYLPCYNTRHTYINLALDNGYTPSMVTQQCGNSEDVINEYYRSKDREPNWNLIQP